MAGVRGFRAGDWIVATILVATFLIPALMLAVGDKPNRFGFQMFSGYGIVDASWRDTEGRDHTVVVTDHLTSARVEIDWPATLPELLCRRIPEAISVEVRQERSSGTATRSTQC